METLGLRLSEELERSLASVADALARCTDAEWNALCAEEGSMLASLQQFWEVYPPADVMPPAYLLGTRICTIFARRYPHLADGEVGTA
jgi:hypothetical protein